MSTKQPVTAEQFTGACVLLKTAHDLAGTEPTDRTVAQYRAVLDAVGELIRQDLGVNVVQVVAVGTTASGNVQAQI